MSSSLGLLSGYGSSSSSSSSDEDGNEADEAASKAKNEPLEQPRLLSNPFQQESSSSWGASSRKPSYLVEVEDPSSLSLSRKGNHEASVFQNPFRAKEDQKKAALERHVQMTERQEDQRVIGGKKVCWNYRKGRCRFGHRCTFAHDSDVVVALSNSSETPVSTSDRSSSSTAPEEALEPPGPYHQGPEPKNGGDDDFESSSTAVISKNKRKTSRPGLSDSIVPGKKAMKFHSKVYYNGGN